MYCFRCGTKVEETTKFCPHCGANILEEQQHYNYIPTDHLEKSNTHEDQYKYSQAYSSTEESLVKAYIGNNYAQLKQNRFSFPAFFFSGYYLIYRKMYLYGFLLLLINMSILLIPELIFVLFIVNIIVATNFNKLYYSFATKKVNNLKQKNENKSTTDLLQLCKQKGGTNIGMAITTIILIFAITFVSAFTYYFIEAWNEETQIITEKQDTSPTIKDATYQIPDGFKASKYINAEYKTYYAENNSNYINIETSNATTLYTTTEEFLKSRVYTNQNNTVSEVQLIPFNNINWSYIEVKSSYATKYIYATSYKNTFYKVEINIYTSSIDQTLPTTFMNSITFN